MKKSGARIRTPQMPAIQNTTLANLISLSQHKSTEKLQRVPKNCRGGFLLGESVTLGVPFGVWPLGGAALSALRSGPAFLWALASEVLPTRHPQSAHPRESSAPRPTRETPNRWRFRKY